MPQNTRYLAYAAAGAMQTGLFGILASDGTTLLEFQITDQRLGGGRIKLPLNYVRRTYFPHPRAEAVPFVCITVPAHFFQEEICALNKREECK